MAANHLIRMDSLPDVVLGTASRIAAGCARMKQLNAYLLDFACASYSSRGVLDKRPPNLHETAAGRLPRHRAAGQRQSHRVRRGGRRTRHLGSQSPRAGGTGPRREHTSLCSSKYAGAPDHQVPSVRRHAHLRAQRRPADSRRHSSVRLQFRSRVARARPGHSGGVGAPAFSWRSKSSSLHGGEMRVDSDAQTGATFHVLLPGVHFADAIPPQGSLTRALRADEPREPVNEVQQELVILLGFGERSCPSGSLWARPLCREHRRPRRGPCPR